MTPPDDGRPQSIIKDSAKFHKYHDWVKDHPQEAQALVAMQVDKIVVDLDRHKKTPINKAHPGPNPGKEGVRGTFNFTAGTWLKILAIIISAITTGAAYNYLAPLIGG